MQLQVPPTRPPAQPLPVPGSGVPSTSDPLSSLGSVPSSGESFLGAKLPQVKASSHVEQESFAGAAQGTHRAGLGFKALLYLLQKHLPPLPAKADPGGCYFPGRGGLSPVLGKGL